jgi:hypothetical protein
LSSIGSPGIGEKAGDDRVKTFSHHQRKDDIRQNAEEESWKGPVSELALALPITIFELTSE